MRGKERVLKIGRKKRQHKTVVLESGRGTNWGSGLTLLSCAKGPLEVFGHKIKVEPSLGVTEQTGGTRELEVF